MGIMSGMKELRDRMDSVSCTKKITDAMKLVAAAKVRKAQEAVEKGRPFNDQLSKTLFSLRKTIQDEDVEVPLTEIWPIDNVLLVIITSDRGLCGGYNSCLIKAAVDRIESLKLNGVGSKLLCLGNKGTKFFQTRNTIGEVYNTFPLTNCSSNDNLQTIVE